MAAKKKSAADKKAEMQAAFDALRKVLAKHERGLEVLHDTEKMYTLVSKKPDAKGKPAYFGSVALKSYVAFHLIPVYCEPALLDDISPELKKRMQGKSCFNFKAPDDALFKELATLTKAGLSHFKKTGVV